MDVADEEVKRLDMDAEYYPDMLKRLADTDVYVPVIKAGGAKKAFSAISNYIGLDTEDGFFYAYFDSNGNPTNGATTGPHLHLGIRVDNKYHNPLDFF